ncbi:MAG: DNA primase [Patescibacteria group bacterium]
MSSHVEKIKEKLSIVDVVGSYIQLEKAGTNYKAKCPFHNEKSPSFFISPDRNTYYCFGCGHKGDILSFVQEFEGLDFMGALRVLAQRAGVTLEKENPTIRTEREKLYLAMEHATLFFQRELMHKTDAKEYLKKRGLVEKTVREWRVGYAPLDWKAVSTYLLTKGFKIEEIEKVGLAKKSDKREGDHYDRFRGRIMFPLFDSSGRVIAFSGRQFEHDGTEAKYINSPETVLFEKSRVLYGFDKAKLEIRKRDYSLLVEGQMDLLMSHQAGVSNAIASSGTALTQDQLEIVRRLSNKVVIAYDGDSAGLAAAARGWQIALKLGMDVKIAVMPKGKDPADLILEDPQAFETIVKNARHIIDVELDRILQTFSDSRERALEVEKNVLPYVAELKSEIEKGHFISKIAHEAKIKEDVIWQEIRKREKNLYTAAVPDVNKPQNKAMPARKGSIERTLFGILFWQEKQSSSVLDSLDIKTKLSNIIGKEQMSDIETEMRKHQDELIFEAEVSYQDSKNLNTYTDELVKSLHEEYLRELFGKTVKELEEAERERNADKAVELLQKCQEISSQLSKLLRERA